MPWPRHLAWILPIPLQMANSGTTGEDEDVLDVDMDVDMDVGMDVGMGVGMGVGARVRVTDAGTSTGARGVAQDTGGVPPAPVQQLLPSQPTTRIGFGADAPAVPSTLEATVSGTDVAHHVMTSTVRQRQVTSRSSSGKKRIRPVLVGGDASVATAAPPSASSSSSAAAASFPSARKRADRKRRRQGAQGAPSPLLRVTTGQPYVLLAPLRTVQNVGDTNTGVHARARVFATPPPLQEATIEVLRARGAHNTVASSAMATTATCGHLVVKDVTAVEETTAGRVSSSAHQQRAGSDAVTRTTTTTATATATSSVTFIPAPHMVAVAKGWSTKLPGRVCSVHSAGGRVTAVGLCNGMLVCLGRFGEMLLPP